MNNMDIKSEKNQMTPIEYHNYFHGSGNTSSNLTYTNIHHMSSTFNVMNAMRRDKLFCDVVVHTDGGYAIHAHKILLAASSSYFFGKFMSSRGDNYQHLRIQGIDDLALISMIEYIYTARIHITQQNVRFLIPAANLLKLPAVRNACCDFLKNLLQPSNCIRIRNFAASNSCPELASFADHFMRQNFWNVVREKEFPLLLPHELANFIGDDNLTIPCEDDIFEVLLMWIRFDVISRPANLVQLIDQIRLPLLSKQYLVKCVIPMLKGDSKFEGLIKEAMAYHTLCVDKKNLSRIAKIKPRGPRKMIIAVCERRDEESICVEFYDFFDRKWTRMSGPRHIENGAGASILGERVYLFGGYNDDGELNTVEIYDIPSDKWFYGSPMQATRSVQGVATIDNSIFVVGGAQNGTNEIYYPFSNMWQTISPMFTNRHFLNTGVVKGLLYAIGGFHYNSDQTLSNVDCYNPVTNEWKSVAAMSTPRSEPGVGVLNDILYVVGGAIESNTNRMLKSVETYDPDTNQWKSIAEMSIGRIRPGVVAYNGMLYVFGGDDVDEDSNIDISFSTMEAYSPRSKSWSIVPSYQDVPYKILSACVAEKLIPTKMVEEEREDLLGSFLS